MSCQTVGMINFKENKNEALVFVEIYCKEYMQPDQIYMWPDQIYMQPYHIYMQPDQIYMQPYQHYVAIPNYPSIYWLAYSRLNIKTHERIHTISKQCSDWSNCDGCCGQLLLSLTMFISAIQFFPHKTCPNIVQRHPTKNQFD